MSHRVPPLVLIVDDDAPILESLGEILADEGYAVATARDGREALAYLASHPAPDCILLDVMMPGMNGYEFRKAQLREPRWAAIPTVLLTAGHVDGRVAELRVSGWLRKPVNLPLLLATVEQHCRRAEEAVLPFPGHLVHVYLQESRMLDRAAIHLGEGIEAGAGALAICTSAHWTGLQDRLAARSLDPSALVREGRLSWVDAVEAFERLTADDPQAGPAERVRAFVSETYDRIAPAGSERPVRVFGETVNLLWRAGRADRAVELERVWNELGAGREVAMLCAYESGPWASQREVDAVCRQHAHVVRDIV